jgi:hypothetical protein
MRWVLVGFLTIVAACGSGPETCGQLGGSPLWGPADAPVCGAIQSGQPLPSGRCDGTIKSCSDCGEFPTSCVCDGGHWVCIATPGFDMAHPRLFDLAAALDLSTTD